MDKKSPLEQYRNLRRQGNLSKDADQELAIERLQLLHLRLCRYNPDLRRGWKEFLFGLNKKQTPPKGVYLYGQVGRGKSMLMDLFFEVSSVQRKRRVHFHSFMKEIHERINDFRKMPAEEKEGDDPLPPIAKSIANATWLLCFDEFEVHDIADAMILGRLFSQLFELGVVVIATSNRAPHELYKNGLNRQLFLPFISIIEKKLDILYLEGSLDHRLARMRGVPVYHTPLDDAAKSALDMAFQKLTDQPVGKRNEITVKGRLFVVPQEAKGVARFTFSELCETALGSHDYLALATHYHTIILSGIPQLGPDKRNEARRFVILIDILYDNGIRLVASAATEVNKIYPSGDGGFEFQRTVSRLIEMQSAGYFNTHHTTTFKNSEILAHRLED